MLFYLIFCFSVNTFSDFCVCVGKSGPTYCVTVKDENDQRALQTVPLGSLPATTPNSSVIQYTPSADGQYYIPGTGYSWLYMYWEFFPGEPDKSVLDTRV